MKAFIVFHTLSKKETNWFKQVFNPNQDLLLVEKPELLSIHPEAKLVDIKKVPMVASYQECLDLVINFGFKKFGGKEIQQWLSFNKKTYWYYTTYKLFNNSKEYFFKRDIINYCFENFEKIGSADEVFVFYKTDLIKKLLSKKKANKVSVIQKPDDYSKQAGGIVKYSLIFLLRVLLGFFQLPILMGKKHVILDKQIKKQKIIDLKTGAFSFGNPSTEYLLEKCKLDPQFLFLTEMRSPKLNEIHQLQIKGSIWEGKYWNKIIHFEIFLFLSLLNPFNFLKLLKFRKELFSIENKIKDELKGKDAALFHGLKTTFKTILLSFLREFGSNLFFKILKPKTFGGAYEQSVENMPLFRMGRSNNTKTYGIQHGVIGPLSISYMFNKRAIEFKPWPDKTIVRGKSYVDLLTQKSSYPGDSVIALGQVRTDCIPVLKSLKKSSLDNSLSDTKPLVTYASQILPTSEKVISDRLAEDFFKLTAKYPEYQFVLKPHPVEKDLDFYHKVAKKIGSSNYKIYQGDLYKLLALSDAVVIFHSTVGGEAVFFEKPVLAMDYFDNDRVGYIKDGVAYKALNYEELEMKLKQIIEKEISLNPKNIKNFILDRAHIIDGKTTQRFYDFIRTL